MGIPIPYFHIPHMRFIPPNGVIPLGIPIPQIPIPYSLNSHSLNLHPPNTPSRSIPSFPALFRRANFCKLTRLQMRKLLPFPTHLLFLFGPQERISTPFGATFAPGSKGWHRCHTVPWPSVSD